MGLSDKFRDFSAAIDGAVGVQGASGYLVILLVVYLGHSWMNSSAPPAPVQEEEEEEPEPPRNFTKNQLSNFDGTKDEKLDEDKPVYLSVNGIVFDVTTGKDFYGPGGPYENFAGHECGVALAKMSFDTAHLDDLEGCKNLNFGEKQELDGWIEKFMYYRGYPVKGRLIDDKILEGLKDRILTAGDLAKNTGADGQEVVEGWGAPSIYVGAGDKVFDVSFGGGMFYGAKGGYSKFAGKDVSRALAKMSFDPEDLANTSTDDLEDKQKKVLEDWITTFEEKKGYPIVGRLKK